MLDSLIGYPLTSRNGQLPQLRQPANMLQVGVDVIVPLEAQVNQRHVIREGCRDDAVSLERHLDVQFPQGLDCLARIVRLLAGVGFHAACVRLRLLASRNPTSQQQDNQHGFKSQGHLMVSSPKWPRYRGFSSNAPLGSRTPAPSSRTTESHASRMPIDFSHQVRLFLDDRHIAEDNAAAPVGLQRQFINRSCHSNVVGMA